MAYIPDGLDECWVRKLILMRNIMETQLTEPIPSAVSKIFVFLPVEKC